MDVSWSRVGVKKHLWLHGTWGAAYPVPAWENRVPSSCLLGDKGLRRLAGQRMPIGLDWTYRLALSCNCKGDIRLRLLVNRKAHTPRQGPISRKLWLRLWWRFVVAGCISTSMLLRFTMWLLRVASARSASILPATSRVYMVIGGSGNERSRQAASACGDASRRAAVRDRLADLHPECVRDAL
jgi:hypothetical protein